MLRRKGPQHVLITTSTFPMAPDDAVSARFVLDLAQHLTAHCRVTVLAPAGPRTQPWERWGEVRVRRFPYFYPAHAQTLAAGEGMVATMRASWRAKLQAPCFVASQWAMLPDLVRDEGIDLINPHWIVPQGFTAALWRRTLGVPMVVTAHGADVALLRRLTGGRRIARFVLERADGVLFASRHLMERTAPLSPRHRTWDVIPMGVHFRTFAPGLPTSSPDDASDHSLLFVGKLVPKKGVDVLLLAVAKLRAAGLPVRLRIVGGGPLEHRLRTLASTLGIAGSVDFLGWRRNDELPSLFTDARVVCLPSVEDASGETEGTPVVLLEAMACGALVVGSRSSGIEDVLTPEGAGLLVPPGDPEALTATLAQALALPRERVSALRGAARDRAAEYSWERIAQAYYAAFSTVRSTPRGSNDSPATKGVSSPEVGVQEREL